MALAADGICSCDLFDLGGILSEVRLHAEGGACEV